jgi:uncharacterized protein (UPF0261 family)
MREYDVMLTGRVKQDDVTILDRLAEVYGLNRSQALRRVIQDAAHKARVASDARHPERAEMVTR